MKIEGGTLLPFAELLTYALIVLGVILPSSIVIYAMRRREKKEEEPSKEENLDFRFKRSPFSIEKSISRKEAVDAKDQLRTLGLEREILSTAIRRLYEAQAEGEITEEEREKIAQTYKSRMLAIKDAISKDESLVALHELEIMQEDLVKLFSERFDDLNTKIEDLRTKVDIEPVREIPVPTSREPAKTSTRKNETKPKQKKSKARTDRRTEAEKRIDKIRAEVEKVLDKLGQMEIET